MSRSKSKLRICCVYQIYNKENGHRYIGGTKDYHHRRWQHLSDLRKGKHYSKLLQSDYDLFGEKSIIFYILEEPKKEKLCEAEQFWLDMIKPEYNTSRFSSMPDSLIVHTKEARQRISKKIKELWKNVDYRINFSKKNRGRISNRKGVILSNETREKLRQANLGKNNPNWGRHRSKESRDKIAKTYKGAISPDGTIYSPIINLREFCRNHELDCSGMSKLMSGKLKSYKGWKAIEWCGTISWRK